MEENQVQTASGSSGPVSVVLKRGSGICWAPLSPLGPRRGSRVCGGSRAAPTGTPPGAPAARPRGSCPGFSASRCIV